MRTNRLILASSSPHRADLLKRLHLDFDAVAPEIDETPKEDEPPYELVGRLAVAKATAVARVYPDCVVVGSDQVAVHQGRIVGKPGNSERAAGQLDAFSGQTVQFLTSVAVLRGGGELVGQGVVETRVEFRHLNEDEIERYVKGDEPYDCAGGFRAESLGAALFKSAFSQDPTAIIGLPLIETARLLRLAGFRVP